jgi:peptide/nickel transport system substrate-binding protein
LTRCIRKALNLAVDRDRLISEVFLGYAHPVAAMASPYSLGVSGRPGALPAQRGGGQTAPLRCRLAATTEVEALSHHLADEFRNARGIEVDLTIIPGEDVITAQKTLVEKNLPLPFDVLVHGWFDIVAG